MLKGRYSTLILAVGLLTALSLATPAAALDEDESTGRGSGSISAGAGQQTISVSVEYTQASGGGGAPVASTSTSAQALVHAPCYFWESGNGKDKAQWLNNPTGWHFASVGELERVKALYPDWERHAAQEGRWWVPMCSWPAEGSMTQEEFQALSKQFYADNPTAVWVPAGSTPPAPLIPPQVLAQAARDAVQVPAPQIGTNPTLGDKGATVVGLDTWVWATGTTATSIKATASAGPLSATVTAQGTGLSLGAPDSTSSCTGWGSPWIPGQSVEGGSDCTIRFTRSSAHLGGTTPLQAGVSYDVSWSSSTGESGTLPPIETTTTINLPVAEIQTINRPTR